MQHGWEFVLCFLGISASLGIAMVIKINIKLFQKHLMPTAMIAGFIGFLVLILSNKILHILSDELLKDIQNTLVLMVYHLMAVGFISLALKDRSRKRNADISNTGFFIVSTYMVQGIVGISIALLLVRFYNPELFTPFGMLLPLGFGQGPGNASSLGLQWESFGFKNGANIGLSVAAIGFLWALVGGVPFMNFLVKRKFKEYKRYDIKEIKQVELDSDVRHTGSVPKSIFIDDLSVQLLLIGTVYLFAYLIITALGRILVLIGNFGTTVAQMLWGFHFLVGTVIALFLRAIQDKLRAKRVIRLNYADNYLLQRIASASFDFMITASIAAISITALKEYLLPVILLTTVGGVVTMIYVYFVSKWIYKKDVLEHIVAMYGMMTGTITTGVALLKEVDPHSRTDVTDHLVLGSGVAIFVGFPIMFILGLPVQGFLDKKPILYVLTYLALTVTALIMFMLIRFNKKKSKR